jgi:hypothetical protein
MYLRNSSLTLLAIHLSLDKGFLPLLRALLEGAYLPKLRILAIGARPTGQA